MMKAFVMQEPRKGKVMEVPDLTPGASQILVKVKYTGLCMSEWHPWDEARPGERFGHEPVGTVAAVGAGVHGFKEGDRVTGLCSTPSLAEYCLFDEKKLLHVPENLKDEDALGEPLSCMVSAASKLRIEKAGDSVLSVGVGYMGLGVMTLLKLQGAGRIIAVDPRPEARENALQFGADEAYAPEELPDQYLVTEWNDTMFERGIHVVSEFAGTEEALRLAGDITGIHGILGAGGWHQGGDRTVDFRQWGWKGITVINIHERRTVFQVECCRNALDMLSKGVWNYKGVGRHIYGLDEFDRANEEMIKKPEGFIKALIRCTDW